MRTGGTERIEPAHTIRPCGTGSVDIKQPRGQRTYVGPVVADSRVNEYARNSCQRKDIHVHRQVKMIMASFQPSGNFPRFGADVGRLATSSFGVPETSLFSMEPSF
jgi:hypothetical protein